MTAVVAVLAVVVAVLVVLVAGLLRSHALVLRRLHEAGVDVGDLGDDGSLARTAASDPEPAPAPDVVAPTDAPTGRPAADVVGVSPTGATLGVAVAGVDHDTVLLFLSSDCATCRRFWDALAPDADTPVRLPADTRLVVVTKGPENESPAAVGERSVTVPVVMSDEAWRDHEVPGSPYAMHVDGPSGRVRGEGTGADWDQVAALLARATGDVGFVGGAPRGRKARRDAVAEQDTDEVLLAAGIRPGDDSLYRRADGTHVTPDGGGS